MLTTGNQLKAARALVDMDQGELARRAGVNINTIGAMEKRGAQSLTSGLDKIKAVMGVLEAEGVEFLNHGQPGVRLQFIEAQPHQRDNGEWGVMARRRHGDSVSWCPTEKAFEAAQEAEGRGDIRLASALREAAEAAKRHAKGQP
jgi:transcriptional regulator with XRE-family HTH domain